MRTFMGLFCALLLDLWQAQLPGITCFQVFQSPVITEQKNCSIPDCFLSGQGKAIPMGYSSNGTKKETVTQRLSLPGHSRGKSGKELSSATFEPWNISRFPLESFQEGDIPLFLTWRHLPPVVPSNPRYPCHSQGQR